MENLAEPQLKFARFEFKYLLSESARKDFERDLIFFMELDPFVKKSSDFQYFVRSLYFDDPCYSAYFDKVDGVKKRSKFRVRTYTEHPSDKVSQFLEIKGRHNQLVFKQRALINSLSNANSGKLQTDVCKQIVEQSGRNGMAQAFSVAYYQKQLKPTALIDYWRRPYISKYDPSFRLTLDQEVSATLSNTLQPAKYARRRCIYPSCTIMEVKFSRQVPAWFHRLIQSHELKAKSISKICKGMEALGLAEDL